MQPVSQPATTCQPVGEYTLFYFLQFHYTWRVACECLQTSVSVFEEIMHDHKSLLATKAITWNKVHVNNWQQQLANQVWSILFSLVIGGSQGAIDV